MIGIAMLSKWHVHAPDYARRVQESGVAKIACVWDEDAEKGKQWAEELGVDFEPDLGKALARGDVDAVVVDAPTSDHCRVIVAAAEAGKHIFTEKAMAPTLEECKRISAAVAKAGVKFCISHPHLGSNLVQYAKAAMDEGLLGRVNYMRMRMVHNGSLGGWLPEYWYDVEKACGGAMMDLGCHPMYVAAFLLGKPQRVASVFNTTYCPAPADDNAVSVVEFENNVIAVLETGFVSSFGGDAFELIGTEGAIVSSGGDVKIRSAKFGVDGWVTSDELPEAKPAPIVQWLQALADGSPMPTGTKHGEALTELLENAYKSHKGQTIVKI